MEGGKEKEMYLASVLCEPFATVGITCFSTSLSIFSLLVLFIISKRCCLYSSCCSPLFVRHKFSIMISFMTQIEGESILGKYKPLIKAPGLD